MDIEIKYSRGLWYFYNAEGDTQLPLALLSGWLLPSSILQGRQDINQDQKKKKRKVIEVTGRIPHCPTGSNKTHVSASCTTDRDELMLNNIKIKMTVFSSKCCIVFLIV